MAKGELYPDHADSVSLILMGDWCSKADIASNEDPGCGEETVADAFKTQKDVFNESFCERNYCAYLTGGPLMGDYLLRACFFLEPYIIL